MRNTWHGTIVECVRGSGVLSVDCAAVHAFMSECVARCCAVAVQPQFNRVVACAREAAMHVVSCASATYKLLQNECSCTGWIEGGQCRSSLGRVGG